MKLTRSPTVTCWKSSGCKYGFPQISRLRAAYRSHSRTKWAAVSYAPWQWLQYGLCTILIILRCRFRQQRRKFSTFCLQRRAAVGREWTAVSSVNGTLDWTVRRWRRHHDDAAAVRHSRCRRRVCRHRCRRPVRTMLRRSQTKVTCCEGDWAYLQDSSPYGELRDRPGV